MMKEKHRMDVRWVQWKIFGKVFFLSKFAVSCLGLLLGLLLLFGGYFFLQQKEDVFVTQSYFPKETTTVVNTITPEPTPVFWKIYIVGAVEKPGLYSLEQGALVYDAVSIAGGLLPEVDAQTVNLAQELESNMMVRILTEEQRIQQQRESSLVLVKNNVEINGGSAEESNRKININIATKEELMTLSGIGEARAESIIAYRETNGRFQTIEDIMLVDGIKESAFAKIKDKITT